MSVIVLFFYAVWGISIIMMVTRVALSIGYNLKPETTLKDEYYPAISVIVPAFNEEVTIAKCVHSLTNLNYPNYEVIVVDDGSTDNTRAIAKSFESSMVKIVHQPNQGKAHALNNGVRSSKGKIVVMIDADTTIQRESLMKIAKRFTLNPQLGAVAGNIKVEQESGLLNALQSTEYTIGINLIRKTQSMFGCVMIVPGPIAAMKKEAILQVGLFSDDTFAEDFDITMKLLKAGYKVEYEEQAIAYTDAPENLEDLIKQRRRWYRGMIQVLDKYRNMYLRPQYGLVGVLGVPNLWFEATAPIINLAMILLALLSGLYFGEASITLIGLATYLSLEIAVGIIVLSFDPIKRFRDFLTVSLFSFYNVFLDGIRLMSLTEEISDTTMVWETPKR